MFNELERAVSMKKAAAKAKAWLGARRAIPAINKKLVALCNAWDGRDVRRKSQNSFES